MKIAVLGGGITGLVCAEVLSRPGTNQITVYEGESGCGGLASGFTHAGWEWSLEKAYHHVFSSDKDILDYSKSIGFDKFFFKSPKTSSMYLVDGKPKLLPIDTPKDLLLFPLLNLFERVRSGVVLLALKLSPHLPIYETNTTESLMSKLMGVRAYNVLFGGLMQKKFGNYAGNILSAFLWARVNKRTKKLGYVDGGFQSFVDFVKDTCLTRGVKIEISSPVSKITQEGGQIRVSCPSRGDSLFDFVVSTLPSPVAAKALENVLTVDEIGNLSNLKHLASMNVIIETKEKLFDSEYWVSNLLEGVPALVFVQHTNFIDPLHYDGKHILYIGNYLTEEDPLWKMGKEDLVDLYKNHLETITGKKADITSSFLFRAKYSQPIFDKPFIKRLPQMATSNSKIFFANLDMTYPYDRGTNYAVRLGSQVAQKVLSSIDDLTQKSP